MKTPFLPIILIIVFSTTLTTHAQQLENLASEVTKAVDQHRDKIVDAAENVTEEINNAVKGNTTPRVKPVDAILGKVKQLDNEKVVQQLASSVDEILKEVPATREEAREVAKTISSQQRASFVPSRAATTKPPANQPDDNFVPSLGSSRTKLSNRTDQPLPSTIGNLSQVLSGPIPNPEPLKPLYRAANKTSLSTGYSAVTTDDEDNAVITSNEVQADQKNKTITFRGNVLLVMKNTELKCDNLIVQLNEKDDPDVITATGGLVQVKQVSFEKGKRVLRVAKGRKAVHSFKTEITTLSGGPPSLQNGSQLIETKSHDAIIYMNRKTQQYRITGPNKMSSPGGNPVSTPTPARSTITVPIGGAKNWDKKLDSSFDIRKR